MSKNKTFFAELKQNIEPTFRTPAIRNQHISEHTAYPVG